MGKSNMKIDARNFKGTRDYLPNEMILRNQMIEKIRRSFEVFGFVPLETPALEYLDVLTGKYGEEGDKLIYRLNYKGGSVAGMKYDLTVPLARVISQHNDIVLPFKRYQIQPVWRADRPQVRQGRFREFCQCDADIVGVKSILADTEIIALIHNILSQLEIGQFVIRINHRKILSGIREYLGLKEEMEIDLCRGIDKLDKIGIDGVKEELGRLGFTDPVMDDLFQLLSLQGPYTEILNKLKDTLTSSDTGLEGINELMNIFRYLEIMNIPMEALKIDLHLARGLDYYTGTIYESSSLDLPHIGSLTGGGRYDRLIGSFGSKDLPAVGTTIGLDRIATVLTQLGKIKDKNSVTQILVTVFDETMINESMKITSNLRKHGFKTELYYEPTKLKKQFSYADKQKIPFVIVIGPDEAEKGQVTLKYLAAGEQKQMDEGKLVSYLKDKLSE